MEYNKIIAVTGLPGLYELLSSKSDGAVVRSLDDKTTRFVSSRIHNFSHLETIEVYTVRDNVNLVDILKAMEGSTTKLPDEKDAGALKNYFAKVYPDLDFTRVYSSDLKKMVKWFQVLKANNIEIKLTEPEEGEAAESGDDGPAVETKAPATRAPTAKAPSPKAPAPKAPEEKTPAAKTPAVKPPAPKAEKKKEEKEPKPKTEKKEPAKKAAAASKKSDAKAKSAKKEPAKKAAKKK